MHQKTTTTTTTAGRIDDGTLDCTVYCMDVFAAQISNEKISIKLVFGKKLSPSCF